MLYTAAAWMASIAEPGQRTNRCRVYQCYTELEFPSLTAKPKEQWGDHLARLRKWKQKPGTVSEYRMTFKLVNAANYGVPQKRMRVFLSASARIRTSCGSPRRDA